MRGDLPLQGPGERSLVFAIRAADLLMMRDDSRFHAGRAPGVNKETTHGSAQNAKFLQQAHSLDILPHHAQRNWNSAQAANIGGYVRRSAEAGGFLLDLHHRYRGFRAYPVNRSPYETIQHDITDDENPLAAKPAHRVDERVLVAVVLLQGDRQFRSPWITDD